MPLQYNLQVDDDYPKHLVPPPHMIEGGNRAAWAGFVMLDKGERRHVMSARALLPCFATCRKSAVHTAVCS